MAENFKLPISSYEELIKIIKAYSTGKEGQPLSLNKIAQTTGIDKTIISGNNGFLVQIELIEKGNKKSTTEKGLKLGRAYTHNIEEDIKNTWVEIIENNEFLTRMLSAVRIRSGMDRASFISHIVYSSGLNANARIKAGAGAIVEILKYAGLITESEGKITIEKASLSFEGEAKKTFDKIPIDSLNVNNKTGSIAKIAIFENNKYQIVLNININSSVNELDTLAERIKNFIRELNK